MAYETELANIMHVTDVLSDITAPAIVQEVVALPLVYSEDVPVGTNRKRFVVDGALTADTLAESTELTFAGGHELTQTSVNCDCVKYVSGAKLTVEAERFSRMTIEEMGAKVGQAIARNLDSDIIALASGFSQTKTATTVTTLDDLMAGEFLIRKGTLNVSSGKLIYIGNNVQIYELKKDLVQSSASIFTQPQQTSLLAGMVAGKGYQGSILNMIDVYVTSGMPTSGSDDVSLLFDPTMAIAGVVDPNVNIDYRFKGAEGFYTEITGFMWAKFVEYVDAAGCGILSNTYSA